MKHRARSVAGVALACALLALGLWIWFGSQRGSTVRQRATNAGAAAGASVAISSTPLPQRTIQFGSRSLGTLYIRPWDVPFDRSFIVPGLGYQPPRDTAGNETRTDWAELGSARGSVTVPEAMALMLDTSRGRSSNIYLFPLLALHPADLQGIFLGGNKSVKLIGGGKERIEERGYEQSTKTNFDLRHLSHLTGLRWLSINSLRAGQISDDDLVHLHSLQSLEILQLNGSNVTQEAVRALRREFLPDADITQDLPTMRSTPTPREPIS